MPLRPGKPIIGFGKKRSDQDGQEYEGTVFDRVPKKLRSLNDDRPTLPPPFHHKRYLPPKDFHLPTEEPIIEEPKSSFWQGFSRTFYIVLGFFVIVGLLLCFLITYIILR